ncbi:hypothetical protein CDEST_12216 [Colletotrichum destructivum]|uniref:Uncharacterized protein n=1 Tax=Colletotrichum destructivum TaxID=34406 RepID=A0AAX4IVF2_9PEZI|nr:hypothetical protein CDEST_12216 [Colletotrichum destructivum]
MPTELARAVSKAVRKLHVAGTAQTLCLLDTGCIQRKPHALSGCVPHLTVSFTSLQHAARDCPAPGSTGASCGIVLKMR